ncbi:MAG: alpha/beta hydrolase [Planctomycetota bacterium]
MTALIMLLGIYPVILLLGAYLAIVLLFVAFQERLIFSGAFRKDATILPDEELHEFRIDTLRIGAGGSRFRVATAGPEDADKFCIGFVGNFERLGAAARWSLGVATYGLRATFVEYPGYGESEGRARKAAILAAAEEAARLVREQAGGRPVLAFGTSLGTFSAVHVTSLGLADQVLLAAPPASLKSVARDQYPWLPVGLFLRHRFDSESLAADIHVPALVIHGDKDRVVPTHHGRRLVEAWRGEAEFVEATGYGHNDLDLSREGPFGRRIAEFLGRSID